ncbi:MAG: GTPase required for pre-60S ribosomal subunit nuclear export and maturation [Alyxoria varia]|nr:MAG: GTPase required for pre-60S ribosomal subunit nuclear export and maturation [Alyxoria varia]
MGTHKKEANRRERQGKTASGSMGNLRTKGENFYRDQKKVKTLSMYNSGKPQRNAEGKITKPGAYQSREKGGVGGSARVEPNRKWFNNTRVIAQDSLAQFREAVTQKTNDPYAFLMKSNKLPMSLIRDDATQTKNGLKQHEAKVAVETRPFGETFGPKAKRKRVKLDVGSVEEMVGHSGKMLEEYKDRQEQSQLLSGNGYGGDDVDGSEATRNDFDMGAESTIAREPIFSKGQSRRIWNEAYKVIDSSDVICFALDARDPEGTRCQHLEKFLREEAPHKHIVFLLNKCDLVPTKVAATWVRHLSTIYPTLAFHASLTNAFGKGTLIQLLRQFSSLHSNRKQLSVGLLGYPNVGKSSIINTLRKKKVCTVAPVPGETKVWQYITLMRRIFLIDAPGVVPSSVKDTDTERLLRGSVRVEAVNNPAQYISAALSRCQTRHVERTYDVKGYESATDFLERLARKMGKLMKGGEPDMDTVAKMVLNDFLRGKIPWFIPPPRFNTDSESTTSPGEGLQEMQASEELPGEGALVEEGMNEEDGDQVMDDFEFSDEEDDESDH